MHLAKTTNKSSKKKAIQPNNAFSFKSDNLPQKIKKKFYQKVVCFFFKQDNDILNPKL